MRTKEQLIADSMRAGPDIINLPLDYRQACANAMIEWFSCHTNYRHGRSNIFYQWLNTQTGLPLSAVLKFLNTWYPLSRHQPQILLQCAAAYTDHADRARVMANYLEEDGLVKPGDDPHYDLLEQLIDKLGGKLVPDPESEKLISAFHDSLKVPTPETASAILAAVEHPALDVSHFLNRIITLAGFDSLRRADLYLSLHTDVEPSHIIWSHGTALRYMHQFGPSNTLATFRRAMSFWQPFWRLAFSRLGFNR